MTLTSLIVFATDAAINADFNAAEMAKQGYWGTMLGILGFLGFALALITIFLRGQQSAITTRFAKSIDANAKLSDAIDKLGDETRESNQKLREYLDSNLDKIAEAIRDIGEEIEDHHKRLTALELEHAAEHTGDRQ